jgi:hypothetical protein
MDLKVECPMNLKGLVGSGVEQKARRAPEKMGDFIVSCFQLIGANARCSL